MNAALLGDIQCKQEQLKIAELNEKEATRMIDALKEELGDCKTARDKLKEYEVWCSDGAVMVQRWCSDGAS